MREFEALTAMGVRHPEHIARYALYMVDNTDILRITLDRKKGAFLPTSVSFRFPRIKKSTLVDSGTRHTEMVYESSLEFRNAVAELDRLVEAKKSSENLEELIEHEVHALEEEVALRIAGIKSLVQRISARETK